MEYKKRDWLRNIRTDSGLTQEEVAKLCSIDRTTYTKAELGYPVHIKTAKRISEVLEFNWVCFYES